jgi:hypothetical protein
MTLEPAACGFARLRKASSHAAAGRCVQSIQPNAISLIDIDIDRL